MVAAPLVDQTIEAGSNLLRLLDKKKAGITDAFWIFDENEGRWLFVLASLSVEQQGVRPVFALVRAVLTEMGQDQTHGLDLDEVVVVSPHSLLIENQRNAYGKVRQDVLGGVRRQSLMRLEPYIYRLA